MGNKTEIRQIVLEFRELAVQSSYRTDAAQILHGWQLVEKLTIALGKANLIAPAIIDALTRNTHLDQISITFVWFVLHNVIGVFQGGDTLEDGCTTVQEEAIDKLELHMFDAVAKLPSPDTH